MKKTVYVEKLRYGDFKVVRVRNGTDPEVGTILPRSGVDELVKEGIEVIVDLPRKRE